MTADAKPTEEEIAEVSRIIDPQPFERTVSVQFKYFSDVSRRKVARRRAQDAIVAILRSRSLAR